MHDLGTPCRHANVEPVRRLLALALFLLTFANARGIAVADDRLLGKMAVLNYLSGRSWTCATDGTRFSVTFEPAPSNTLHEHGSTGTVAFDDYFGYDAKRGGYWIGIVTNAGFHGFLAGDGVTFRGKLYDGSTPSATIESTYSSISPTQFRVRDVSTAGGSATDTICTTIP